MSELQQINAKINAIEINQKNTDGRLEKHENKIEVSLGDIAESLKNISEVMIKQEIQGKSLEENHEDIRTLTERSYEQDKQLALAIQSRGHIEKLAEDVQKGLKKIITWGFGLFGSLIILLVGAAIKAFAS